MGSIYDRNIDDVVQFYDALAEAYRWKHAEDVAMQRSFITPLFPRLNPSSLVLDLCCGSGCFSRGLSAAGNNRYIGVDASAKMIERARREFPDKEFRIGRGESLRTIVPETCDAFSIVHGFTHLPPSIARKVLKSLRSVLKPGAVGVVIAGALTTLPQSRVSLPTKADLRNPNPTRPPVILVVWSVHELLRCFEEAGFRELDIKTGHTDMDNLPFYFEAV